MTFNKNGSSFLVQHLEVYDGISDENDQKMEVMHLDMKRCLY